MESKNCGDLALGPDEAVTAPFRPTVSRWRPRSLRVRLILLVAFIVAGGIGFVTSLETRVFERSLESDLRETTRGTAQAIADDLELRVQPIDRAQLASWLHEFTEAVPALRAVSVVLIGPGGPDLAASTSSEARPETLALAEQAIEHRDELWLAAGSLPKIAVPVVKRGRPMGAVVVTVSLAAVDQVRDRGRSIALGFALVAIIGVVLAIDLLTRRFIHRPLGSIRDTMVRAGRGDLQARAQLARPDEIGAIALGLNEMLDQMGKFNSALEAQVRRATEELRARNRELMESYERLFELRGALAHAEQLAAVGHMAANVAHQMGTPLNLISGCVQLLRERPGLDPAVAGRLQIIAEQIDKAAATVRTLLDRARPTSPPSETDVGELVGRICEMIRPRLDAAGIDLSLTVEPRLPHIRADAVQLELAVLNVVVNAIDAMPGGGGLSVSITSAAPDRIVVEVADTGRGIAPEVLPKIFEPWVTTKPKGRGTGLGLSIARDVIVAQGGSITAHERSTGGALFRIELPARSGEVLRQA